MTDASTMPKPPANLAPYVEAIGAEDAVRLFLALGGTIIYLPKDRSTSRSRAAQVIGARKVETLAGRLGLDYVKVPLAKEWIARVMFAQGETIAEIARTVRSDVSTVRRWLGPSTGARQMDLFSV
ncbi:helix-turn-helix domain containing protein [Sinorhizobium meliloti]|nr:helix-turn-helix domain containing protein [Sinorhizobium meliloti]RVK81481.1 helix-turn-helix domain containing protein [Sinorhizobium meliloti]RVQ78103.1 helix-turn-helix domain containing protein [Sinorhizobium meliloti]